MSSGDDAKKRKRKGDDGLGGGGGIADVAKIIAEMRVHLESGANNMKREGSKICMGVAGLGIIIAGHLSHPEQRFSFAARCFLAALLLFPICAELLARLTFRLLGNALPFTKKGRITLQDGRRVFEGDIVRKGQSFVRTANTAYRNVNIRPEAREGGRYVLVASRGCPWAHRTIIARNLLKLEDTVPLAGTATWDTPLFSAMLPAVATGGWQLKEPVPPGLLAAFRDAPPVADAEDRWKVYRLYQSADPGATGRVTVPCLFDAKDGKIVNNESVDIVRIFNGPLRHLSGHNESSIDLRPESVSASELDEMNDLVYTVNNGVYKCGFAGKASSYVESKRDVFDALKRISNRLETTRQPFLMGDQITEVDVRAFTTLLRFDLAYFHFFRVNDATLRHGFPLIHEYLLRMLSIREFSDSVDMLAYVTMYGIICQWEGRVAGNVTRWAIVLTHLMVGAARPDAPSWRRRFASLILLPLRLLALYVPGYQ